MRPAERFALGVGKACARLTVVGKAGWTELALIAAAIAAPLALGAAQRPSLLERLSGGLWEISRSASGAGAAQLCAPDPAILAQYEHRRSSCTRVVISDERDGAVIHYTCSGSGFGQTRITLLTPRSMRLETQGISSGVPFAYTLHARLVGPCAGR